MAPAQTRNRPTRQLFALVASLPPGEAVRLHDVEEDKLDKRLRANLFNLKKVWRACLGAEKVERSWDAEGGVIYLNDALVTVDLHAFLQAAQDGDRARAATPPRTGHAVAAYRRTLALYTSRCWSRLLLTRRP